jgi:predicted component of type VI protein secretion system
MSSVRIKHKGRFSEKKWMEIIRQEHETIMNKRIFLNVGIVQQ